MDPCVQCRVNHPSSFFIYLECLDLIKLVKDSSKLTISRTCLLFYGHENVLKPCRKTNDYSTTTCLLVDGVFTPLTHSSSTQSCVSLLGACSCPACMTMPQLKKKKTGFWYKLEYHEKASFQNLKYIFIRQSEILKPLFLNYGLQMMKT